MSSYITKRQIILSLQQAIQVRRSMRLRLQRFLDTQLTGGREVVSHTQRLHSTTQN
jgi:hypothetical protein